MTEEPIEPYVYQPYGIQDSRVLWDSQKVYGVAGGLFTIKGISKQLATKIVEWMKEEEASHD